MSGLNLSEFGDLMVSHRLFGLVRFFGLIIAPRGNKERVTTDIN